MNEWTCSCGHKNNTPFCTACGKPKPQSADDTNDNAEWTCSCGHKNTTAFCTACGKPKDARQPAPKPEPVVDNPPAPKPAPAPPPSNSNLKTYLLIGGCFLAFIIAGVGAFLFLFSSDGNVSSKPPTNQNLLPVQTVEEVNQVKPSSPFTDQGESKPTQIKQETQQSAPVKTVQPLGGNWIRDLDTDIYIWNPDPRGNESITWSGGYVQDGDYKYADGSGVVTWYRDGKLIQTDTGSFEHGRHHGQFKHELRSGNVIYSRWEHGKEIDEKNVNFEAAKQTFLDYHNSITAGDFRAAYNMLTDNQKQRMGSDLKSYASGYATTISSTVTNVKLISGDGNSYTLGYRLQARDTYRGNKVLVQEFEGQVTLVNSGGRWGIDNTQSKKISERVE